MLSPGFYNSTIYKILRGDKSEKDNKQEKRNNHDVSINDVC